MFPCSSFLFVVMGRWVIYKKDGSERKVVWGNGTSQSVKGFVLPELEYHGEWMGQCFVTLSIRCAAPIDFEIGDYIIYRGERFVINYDPTVIKKARKETYGEGFTYDNVKFNSLGNELTDMRMLDYVLSDNNLHYSGLPTFSFFCTDIDDLADRLQVNASRWCTENEFQESDYWVIVTPSKNRTLQRCESDGQSAVALSVWNEYFYGIPSDDQDSVLVNEKVNQNVNVDNQNVWECCKNIKDVFGLNFICRGRAIIIGAVGIPTQDVFSYGKGNGLYEIERVADESQQVITKLYAYGSERNLPVRYYANIDVVCTCTVTSVEDGIINTDINFSTSYFKGEGTSGQFNVTVSYGNRNYSVVAYNNALTGKMIINALSSGLSATTGAMLTFVGGIDVDKWPADKRSQAFGSMLPNNMAINRLMLPGFPKQSLYDWVLGNGGTALTPSSSQSPNTDRYALATWNDHIAYFSKDKSEPFILSVNINTLGIREGTKFFDGSDGDEEIYPTIEGTGYDIIVGSDTIDDNGVYAEGAEVNNFDITLPNFGSGFDLAALLQNDTEISMKDGYCGGRSFLIKSAERNGSNQWVCNCERAYDNGLDLWFPYSYNASTGGTPAANEPYQVRTGDKYVLTGIEMTSTYIDANAEKLLEASLLYLDKNDYVIYTYVPKVDEIKMARQHDDAVANSGRSYYLTLKEGDTLLFEDEDLNVDGSIYIDTLVIKEYGNGCIPTYDLTLRDDKQVGSIERIQEKLSSLSSTIATGGGGGLNIPQIRQLIQAYGGNYYLSKLSNDTASGKIRFLQGLISEAQAQLNGGATFGTTGNYGVTSGGDATFDDIYAAFMTLTNNLNAHGISAHEVNADILNAKAAHFAQLIIDELRSAGGAYLLSAADCTIDYVETLDLEKHSIVTNNPSFYRCYYKANDNDGRAIFQKFKKYDQVMHTSFDAADTQTYSTQNRYYWILVDAVSTEPVEKTLEDGNDYPCHWIDLDVRSINTRSATSNANPEVGDDIVLLGHRGTYSDRRSAIYITAYTNSFDQEVEPPAIVFYQNVGLVESGAPLTRAFSLSAADGRKPNYWGRDKVVVTGQLNYTSTGSGTGTDVGTMVGGDSYKFWVDKPYQQYSGSGNLVYQIKMIKNGSSVAQANVEEYLAKGTASGCVISGPTTDNATVYITPEQGATSGYATIACYTSTTHSTATFWGYVTLLFGVSSEAQSQYLFWLDKPYQQYSGSGTLTYNINLSVNGVDTNPSAYLGTPTNTNCTSSITGKVLTVTPTEGATSGSVVINCYTSTTTKTGATMWGQLTASFATSADGVPQYVFYLEQDTKKVKCNGGSKTNPSLDQTSLTYNVSLKIDNELQSQNVVGDYISAGTGANCDVSVNSTTGVVTLTNLGKDDKTIGGSGTILCYTDTAKTKLWGVLTAKFNVSWSSFAFNIVDNELTSMADETDTDSLGYKIAQNRTSITQNTNSITAIAGGVDTSEVNLSTLKIQSDKISTSVSSQKYNSNLFGFTDGLSFTGSCVPFIQAYGVEIVAAGTMGHIIGFGGVHADNITVSCYVKAQGATTSLTCYVNGTQVHTRNIGTDDWEQVTFTADISSTQSFNSLSFYHTNSSARTVAMKELKVETGIVATAFCISDSDGTKIVGDNMFTTTTNYNGDPIFNKLGSNEILDTSNTEGHGSVMRFYRNNSSDPFMAYNNYDWDNTQYAKVLTAGKVYTISFWARSEQEGLKIHTGIYSYVTASGSSSGNEYNKHNIAAVYTDKATEGMYDNAGGECIHTLTTSWKRYYAHFYIMTGVTSAPIIQCNNGLLIGTTTSKYVYIADVRMEEGYIADESDPMSISGARTRSEAKFNLTADNIELKLNNTGIDIENNLITLDANKTIVNGELQASKVLTSNKGYGYIDMTDGLMKVFNPNGVNQIVFGVDNSGNIILQYLDKDTGRILWDLGPSGLSQSASQDERVVTYTWCMMKDWNSSNNTWEQVGLDAYDTDVNALDNYYRQIQNGASMSYLAYLIKNGIANGNGTVYQYEAKINGGQYIGTAMSNNSATVAEVYDKLFLQRQPSSSSPLAVSGGGAASNSWYAGFIRIKRFEIWRTYDMGATITQSGGKSYVIPSGYVDGVNGDMVDFSVDTANLTYNDPPVCFLAQSYEYGVLKEDIPYYINYSKIEGL